MKAIKVKSSNLSNSGLRMDASLYLSEGIQILSLLNAPQIKTKPLKDITSDIFYGNRSRRIYVTNPKNGIPFIKGADITKSDFSSLKLLSKKKTKNLESYALKEGWTLITRSGSIGNTVFVNRDFIGKAASDDIIRVCPKEIPDGFLYAYLSSKFGNTLLTQSKYGAVIQHIEPEHIENIPVPLFLESKQQEIHDLIIESANLRVEANLLLEDAISELEKELPTMIEHKYEKVSLSLMIENGLRMEATTNYIQIKHFYEKLNEKYEIRTIADMSKEVFTPNIFKRQRTNDVSTGIPFLSGSDLTNFRPSFTSFLSKKMKNIDNYILRDGWIAVQDAGTIGYVTLINGYLDGVSATNNLVRIIPNKENDNLYIFAFLKTKQGQFILKSQQFGSVQKHIDNNAITNFKIPILNSYERVKSKVLQYNLKTTESCIKENQAISLVEKEIESWQQS